MNPREYYPQRRKSDWSKSATLIVMLVFNVAAIIWGASRAMVTLDNLQIAINELNATTKAMSVQVYDHDARLRLLERINANR